LPINPYLLGYWLGDGASHQAAISVGRNDVDWLESELARIGQPCYRQPDKENFALRLTDGKFQGATRYGALPKPDSFYHKARALGLMPRKFVPEIYMRASIKQRLALLQGLMDSDGCASGGSASFSNKEPWLAKSVAELARSLGYIVHTRRTDFSDSRPIYKLGFTPVSDVNPFRMPRKARQIKPRSNQNSKWMKIKSIEPCESVPVKCIEVDSPDHLFLAGKSWIATHNTEAWVQSNGGHNLFQVMDRNAAKSKSRLMETANSWKPGEDSVAEQNFNAWVAEQEGKTLGTAKTLMDVRMAPPESVAFIGSEDDKIVDRDALVRGVQFAYGDCYWVDAEDIVDNHILDLKTPFDVSKRFYLNWPTVSEDAWIEPYQWSRWGDPELILEDGAEIALGFDGSRTNDATALIACEISTGNVFDLGIWETYPSPDNPKVRITIPVDEVDAAVDRAFARFTPVAFFADVREWESFSKVEWPKRFGSQLKLWARPSGQDPQPIAWDMRTHTGEFTAAAELVNEEITGDNRVFSHDASGILGKHVVQMRNRPNRWGTSVGKESPLSAKKIDAGVAMILARHARRLYLAQQQEKPSNEKPRSGRVYGEMHDPEPVPEAAVFNGADLSKLIPGWNQK
jgi:hypothetical protein